MILAAERDTIAPCEFDILWLSDQRVSKQRNRLSRQVSVTSPRKQRQAYQYALALVVCTVTLWIIFTEVTRGLPTQRRSVDDKSNAYGQPDGIRTCF